jgi:hypothetical protein
MNPVSFSRGTYASFLITGTDVVPSPRSNVRYLIYSRLVSGELYGFLQLKKKSTSLASLAKQINVSEGCIQVVENVSTYLPDIVSHVRTLGIDVVEHGEIKMSSKIDISGRKDVYDDTEISSPVWMEDTISMVDRGLSHSEILDKDGSLSPFYVLECLERRFESLMSV